MTKILVIFVEDSRKFEIFQHICLRQLLEIFLLKPHELRYIFLENILQSILRQPYIEPFNQLPHLLLHNLLCKIPRKRSPNGTSSLVAPRILFLAGGLGDIEYWECGCFDSLFKGILYVSCDVAVDGAFGTGVLCVQG